MERTVIEHGIVTLRDASEERDTEVEEDRCPDCGGTESGSCFYCKTD